ncbi:MAG: glycosyltransferase family 2 protein [Sphingobacteriales bacterium]|nr:glycosyltransferase family 2 protein [Sphingobacteriales bacterium]
MKNHHYPNVELLITHYNRSSSLERLLKAFENQATSFGNIVVSDDGSKTEHLEELLKLQKSHQFNLVTTQQNKGLGNNLNKGQEKVSAPFVLYVQEDFVPQEGFNENFSKALMIMEMDDSIDIIRFYAYFAYPYLEVYDNQFSEMKFSNSILKADHLKFYVYSDHPHLRRSNFLKKFGKYKEGLSGDVTEFDMCLSFVKNKGRGLFINNFKVMFEQMNTSAEPSTMNRREWKRTDHIFMKVSRAIYLKFRLMKNTLQLLFYRN